jgi:hypothetical protein
MLDSGDSTNVMSLKVMNELGLETTRPYKNVCGIDSKEIKVCGLIKDLRVYLAAYPDISILMDVVVIDVPDAWGMLLSRKWDATLGGSLQMDLSYATIPTRDGTYVTLYRQPIVKNQVEDPNVPLNEDDLSDDEFEELEICARINGEDHYGNLMNYEEPIIPSPNLYCSPDFTMFPFSSEEILMMFSHPRMPWYNLRMKNIIQTQKGKPWPHFSLKTWGYARITNPTMIVVVLMRCIAHKILQDFDHPINHGREYFEGND